LFIIGGAETYKNFADFVDEWIVTEIPETIEDADTFMPTDFLNDFSLKDKNQLEDDLQVKFYSKK
jgi:dihydrofolate reductase